MRPRSHRPSAPLLTSSLGSVLWRHFAGMIFFVAGAATADPITPTDVGGAMGNSTADRKQPYAINNSGLGAPQVGGYDTHIRAATGVQWLSADNKMPGSMTYDLGAIYNLTNMVLWNYDENNNMTNRGIKEFSIEYYDKTNGLITSAGPYTPQSAIFSGGRVAAEVIDIADVNNVNKIKLVGITNFGTYTVVGMCELKFEGTYVSAWENYTPLELVSPTGAVSTMADVSAERALIRSYDASGISPAPPPLTSTNTHGTTANNNIWEFNDNDMPGTVTYAFSNVMEVSALALWNENEVANKSIKDFDIIFLDRNDTEISSIANLVARPGGNGCYVYELETDGSVSVLHGPLAQNAGTVPEVFSFTPVQNVKKVRLSIKTNYGSTSAGGISEIGIYGRVVPPGGTVMVIW